MSRRHRAATLSTSDSDAAAFYLVSGLILLRIDGDHPRVEYVLGDKYERGPALRAAFANNAPAPARELLRARRWLIAGAKLAQVSPTRCLLASELEAHWAQRDAERRTRWTGAITAGGHAHVGALDEVSKAAAEHGGGV